jgi:hypothetical protein
MGVGNSEHQSNRKECRAEPNGKFPQHMGRLRTEYVLRDSPSKGGPKPLAARKLHQNDEHKQQTNYYMENQQDRDDQPHSGKNRNLLHAVAFVKVVPVESLDPPRAS